MTTRRRILLYVATALAAIGVFGGDAAQAQKRPSLKLTVSVSPTTILEGSTATGTVTHNNASVSSPVTVTLKSSDTTEATVAATVTIPAGTNTVNFAVTAINDGNPDGPQSVTITTSATGYASASASVTVNDVPTFHYLLTIPQMPAAATGGPIINDLNNRGQVVGWYQDAQGQKGFLYDPSIPGGVIDLSSLSLPGIPAGYRISSAVGINDHEVLVGYLTNDFGASGAHRIAFALDWAAESPVVDLLPNMGSPFSYGRKINENGDILGIYDTIQTAYLFNPGLYAGDPAIRALRDGQAVDFSNDTTSALPFGSQIINNPVGNSPARVAGKDSNGVAFRYTTGLEPNYEPFPDIVLGDNLGGINDAGTFCGVKNVRTMIRKNQYETTRVPFRYTSAIDTLPIDQAYAIAGDINNSGDVVGNTALYRTEWGGWRQLTDLPVVGQNDDMLFWFTGSPVPKQIGDRVTADDAGYVTGGISGKLFVLTPVPVL